MSESMPHVSDLRWDRLLAGELDDGERAEVLAHAEHCAACEARRAEITAGFDAFANIAPALPRRPRQKRWLAASGAMAAIAVAAAVLLVVRAPSRPRPEGERIKGTGGPQLVLAAGSRERLATVVSGDAVHPGDSIQAAYTTTRDGFGAVLARDGSGAAMSYVPADGDAMVPLPPGTLRSFPGSTILDDVLGAQVVAIVWCETPSPLAPLLAELRSTGGVTAPTGCTVESVKIEVRSTP